MCKQNEISLNPKSIATQNTRHCAFHLLIYHIFSGSGREGKVTTENKNVGRRNSVPMLDLLSNGEKKASINASPKGVKIILQLWKINLER